MKKTIKFELFGIFKTITLICFILSLVYIFGPFFILIKEPQIFEAYYEIIKTYIDYYIYSLPIFIGALIFLFVFIIKKNPPP